MNDKDKEEFEKWLKNYISPKSDIISHMKESWQAACEYKQKEINDILDKEDMLRDYIDYRNNIRNEELEAELLEYKEAARSEAQLVNELQAENTALRANINGTRMKQMNERIEELLIENAKLEKKVQRTKLFLKERLSYAHEDKDELFVNKYCLMALLEELGKE